LWNALSLGRRASVAMWIAVMTPGLIMVISMAVQVGAWAAAEASVQRSADLAAVAGVANYKNTQNATTAATFAARFAQMNINPGITTALSWTGSCTTPCTSVCTVTGTESQVGVTPPIQITAQVILCGGLVSTSDAMLKVTVQKPIQSYLSFNGSNTNTITATSTAELVTTTAAGSGGQPCLLALSSSGTISSSGSTYWGMPNCTVRSNGTISVTGGGGPLTTGGIYAGGTISIAGGIIYTPDPYNQDDGIIPDPYASDTRLQNEMTTAAGLTGVSNIACGTVQGVNGTAGQYTGGNNCNGTNVLPNGGSCVTGSGVVCTMYPGNYGTWSVPQGGPYTFNLQPGLYLFSGAITLTENTTTNGTGGVTIITAGAFQGENTFVFNVTAPTPAQVTSKGGVAGIVLAGSSSSGITLSGSVAFNEEGVVYFPNGPFNASGSSCASGSGYCNGSVTCLEIIASSIELSGNANFSSNCNSLGVNTFSSVGGSTVTTARVTK
jgi:hypothetical protein